MRRLHLPAVMAALAAVLAVGACGSSRPDGEAPLNGTSGPAPSVVPPPTAPPGQSPSAGAQPTVKPAPAPTYPTTPRKYAEAVIAAWQQDRFDVIGNLATAGVREKIREVPSTVNPDWTFMRTRDASGSTDCTFINAVGDLLTLRISRSLLGKARATIEFRLDVQT